MQVPTAFTTIASVMASAAFRRGVDDVRRQRPPRFDAEESDGLDSYERGRLFAAIAPRTMPVLKNGRLHPPAVAICRKAFAKGEII
jgi:hypothetical protein